MPYVKLALNCSPFVCRSALIVFSSDELLEDFAFFELLEDSELLDELTFFELLEEFPFFEMLEDSELLDDFCFFELLEDFTFFELLDDFAFFVLLEDSTRWNSLPSAVSVSLSPTQMYTESRES